VREFYQISQAVGNGVCKSVEPLLVSLIISLVIIICVNLYSCLYIALIRSRLEFASVVWNTLPETDANKIGNIQREFASLCYYRFAVLYFT
jgi:hypothetical protein